MMIESILIDAVVIVLLGATIFVAFRLDRRLQSVRNVQHELASVIRELNAATGQELEAQIRNARAAGDELAILLKSTEKAGRTLQPVRAEAPVASRPSAVPMPRPQPQPEARSTSALDALRSLAAR
jgi:hypothetical protein